MQPRQITISTLISHATNPWERDPVYGEHISKPIFIFIGKYKIEIQPYYNKWNAPTIYCAVHKQMVEPFPMYGQKWNFVAEIKSWKEAMSKVEFLLKSMTYLETDEYTFDMCFVGKPTKNYE